jgi:hypothetical protein
LEKIIKGIVSETHSVANLSHAKVQKACNIVKYQIHTENVDGYANVPSLFAKIIKCNPGSRLCCQVSSKIICINYLCYYQAVLLL